MLPKTARVHRPRQFREIFNKGTRTARGGIVIHWLTRPAGLSGNTEPTRAGFVVSKAVGNAVTRNKVKRRLRAIVAKHLTSWPPGAYVIIRANPKAAQQEFHALEKDVVEAVDVSLRKQRSSRSKKSTLPS